MKGWSFLKIKDYPIQIIDGDRGTNYPTKEEFLQEGYCLFLNTGNVTLSGFHFDEKAFVTEDKHKKLRKGHLQRYDSVLTTRGTIGNVAFYGDSIPYDVVRINSGMLILRPDQSKLDPRFFYGLLRSSIFQQQADLFRYGAAQPQLPITTLKHIRLPLPPLPIQQKVAGILSAYDDLIENNLKRIKLLEEMAQITYEEWFVRLRFPGHESTPINPETGLPEGWKSIRCYDAMEVMSGGTPKTGVEEYWNGNIPFYTPKDAVDSSYVFETEKYVTELGVRKCNSKLYPKDTVFITARGTVGKVNLAGQPMAMNQSCYALTGKEGITIYFLFFAVKASVEAFKGASNGGVFNTIVVDTFRYLPFTKPTQDLMKKFEGFVSPILAEVSNLTQQNQRLREARDILLPRLMTGVIDVESYDPAQLLKEAA